MLMNVRLEDCKVYIAHKTRYNRHKCSEEIQGPQTSANERG